MLPTNISQKKNNENKPNFEPDVKENSKDKTAFETDEFIFAKTFKINSLNR